MSVTETLHASRVHYQSTSLSLSLSDRLYFPCLQTSVRTQKMSSLLSFLTREDFMECKSNSQEGQRTGHQLQTD